MWKSFSQVIFSEKYGPDEKKMTYLRGINSVNQNV